MTDKIVVFTTADSREKAEELARGLLEHRLAACVNLLPGAHSLYHWQGQIEESTEWVLLIKTRRDLFARLQVELRKMHTYEVPECIALPVIEGSADYLAWLDRELAPEDR